MNKRHFFILSCILLSVASCSNNEIGNSKDVSQDAIYQDYTIKYAEGEPNVEVKAQYRFGGSNGTTLVLTAPSGVAFDGDNIKVDSSKYGGAYYRSYELPASFPGKHSFVFTTTAGKKFSNEFLFEKIQVLNPPASFSKTAPLVINFDPAVVHKGDRIELRAFNTDSSFTVNETIEGSTSVSIPVKDLQRQKGKGFSLDIQLSRDIALKETTPEGGKMELTYRLKPVKLAQ